MTDGCPSVATLLAAVAAPHAASRVEHVDGCSRCRARAEDARRAAEALDTDVGCDVVEALLAEVDDGGRLGPDDQARVLAHFVGCEPCRGRAALLDTAAPASRGEPAAPELPVVSREHYQFEDELARGGMGRIVRAVDRRLGRRVAVKEVLGGGSFADVRVAHARLAREARIAARLSHPAIVSVHEAGVWPRGSPFIAMDLVAGRSLDRVIADARGLDGRLALLPHVIAVADALAYAHSQGIIHRDLKPANVLVGDFGETVVIDWGLAKELDAPEDPSLPSVESDAGELTQAGALVGTPSYMPPEQAEGDAVDRRADVYALGAMLYHLLGGKPPYAGTPWRELMEAVRSGGPQPIAAIEPRVPPALAAIVAKAMARAPGERFASAAEVAEELRRFQTGKLVASHRYRLVDLVRHWLAHRRVSVAVAVALAAATVITGAVGLARVLAERDRAQRESERLVVARARSLVARDPTMAMAWLARLPDGSPSAGEAQAVAAEAEAAGVARRVLASHAAQPTWLVTSADGRLAVSGALDGELRLWDLAAGTVRRLGAHGGTVYELALSSDGRWLAVAGEGGLDLWDLASGVPRPLAGHRGAVFTVGWAAGDRELVSGGQDGTVRRWPLAGGAGRIVFGVETTPTRRLTTVRGDVAGAQHVMSYHEPRRGLTVVVTAAGEIVALDDGGSERWRAPHPGGAPIFATLSPRGDLLATVGRDGELRRFDVATGVATSLGARPDVPRLEISPDGRWLAAATRGDLVRVFDLRDGSERVLRGHTLPIYRVAFSADSALLASASADGTVRVWDPAQGELWTLRGHRAAVRWLTFGAGGALLSLSSDGTARLWRPPARAARVLPPHEGPAYGAHFAARAPVAATGGTDGKLRVFDTVTLTHRDLVHPAAVYRAYLAPEGRRAVTSDAKGVCRLWDLAAGTFVVLAGDAACRGDAAFDPRGAEVATLDRDRVLRVWTLADPSTPTRVEERIVALAYDATGALQTVAADGVVRRGGAVTATVPAPDLAMWSEDGSTLAAIDRTTITLLTGDRRLVAPRPAAPFQAIALAPDGARLAIGDLQGRLHLVDARSGEVQTLGGHTDGVVTVALSSRWAASASQGELLLWDLSAGCPPRRLYGHAQWANDLAFAPDGNALLSAGTDGSVRLWAAELATPKAIAIVEATDARLGQDDELVIGGERP